MMAVVISLFILWLHVFFLLHAGGLWRDEVNLVNLSSRHSLAEMARDSFPVLMPALVRGWTAIGWGGDDFGLRLLGMWIGLSLPAALWFAAWRIRRSPPLLGLLLLGINTTVIEFGDSLRAFGLGSAAILLTVAAAGLLLRHPTWPRALGLAVLATLSVQALYQNAIFVAAVCLGAWAVCLRRKHAGTAGKILVVAFISAASLLPYWSRMVTMPDAAAALRTGFRPEMARANLDHAIGSPLSQSGWVWEFLALALVVCGVLALRRRPPEMAPCVLRRTDLSRVAVALAAAFGFVWFAAAPWSRWPLLPLLLLAVAALDSSRWTRRFFPGAALQTNAKAGAAPAAPADAGDSSLFAAVTLLTAVAAFAGFLWYAKLLTEPWYFIPLMALAAACFEMGLPLSGLHARAAVFGLALITTFEAGLYARGELNWRFTNIDLVARRLATQADPDDFIIVTPWYCGIPFDRYFKGATAWDTLPPLADHSIHRYDLVRMQMETPDALGPVLARMAATLQAGHRVWMVQPGDLPKTNAPAGAEPGPPPLKNSGWSVDPYTAAWSAQAAGFLAQHSRRFSQVYYSTNLNIAPENMKLDLAEGWREEPESLGHTLK